MGSWRPGYAVVGLVVSSLEESLCFEKYISAISSASLSFDPFWLLSGIEINTLRLKSCTINALALLLAIFDTEAKDARFTFVDISLPRDEF